MVVSKENLDHQGHFEAYFEYSKTIRIWFVSYGIGAPIVFLTQSNLMEIIISSSLGKDAIDYFLYGVVLQISISIINKWNNWHLYAVYDEKNPQNAFGRIDSSRLWRQKI